MVKEDFFLSLQKGGSLMKDSTLGLMSLGMPMGLGWAGFSTMRGGGSFN